MKILKIMINIWNNCTIYNKIQKEVMKLFPKTKFHKVKLTSEQIDMLNYLALNGINNAIILDKLLNYEKNRW